MQFFGLIALFSLLLIQSEVTHATFVCNHKNHPTQHLGICAKKLDGNEKSYEIHDAVCRDPANLPYNFTCDEEPYATLPSTLRLCCDQVTAPNPLRVTRADFASPRCYLASSPNTNL